MIFNMVRQCNAAYGSGVRRLWGVRSYPRIKNNAHLALGSLERRRFVSAHERRSNLKLVRGWVPVQQDGLAALYKLARGRVVNVEHFLSDGAVDTANGPGDAPGVKGLGYSVINERALIRRGTGKFLKLRDVSAVPLC